VASATVSVASPSGFSSSLASVASVASAFSMASVSFFSASSASSFGFSASSLGFSASATIVAGASLPTGSALLISILSPDLRASVISSKVG